MMPWEFFDVPLPQPSAKKGECVCRNHSLPINGIRYVSPSCPIHYSQLTASTSAPKIKPTLALTLTFALTEATPNRKKRITYPKMTVAKRQLAVN